MATDMVMDTMGMDEVGVNFNYNFDVHFFRKTKMKNVVDIRKI